MEKKRERREIKGKEMLAPNARDGICIKAGTVLRAQASIWCEHSKRAVLTPHTLKLKFE
jgi:hypothetical protein